VSFQVCAQIAGERELLVAQIAAVWLVAWNRETIESVTEKQMKGELS